MTETTLTAAEWAALRASHGRPCFCGHCLGPTLWELLDERAAILGAAFDDRLYADGMERDLADELIHGIPAGDRAAVLRVMARDHIEPRVMAVDCLLNECDQRSYDAAAQMADILVAAIWDQDNGPVALRILVEKEIREREAIYRRIDAARQVGDDASADLR
jgi:hypothetical protein